MLRRLLVLAFFTLIPLSTCGGDDSTDAVIDALPGLVPSLEEVRGHFPEMGDEPLEVDAKYWPNSEVSDTDDPILRYDSSAEDLDQRGRVTGYRADYFIGERNTFRGVEAGVTVVIDLFENADFAKAEVARLPARAYRSDAQAGIGEQALAWGFGLWTSPEGVEPQCPCPFRFRLGRMVGYVRVWYNWPFVAGTSIGTEFDPAELELARALAERMQAALAES